MMELRGISQLNAASRKSSQHDAAGGTLLVSDRFQTLNCLGLGEDKILPLGPEGDQPAVSHSCWDIFPFPKKGMVIPTHIQGTRC